MPQSLARILVRTVFSTKDRRPFLRDTALRQELHHYLGGILKNLDCQPIILPAPREIKTYRQEQMRRISLFEQAVGRFWGKSGA